MSASGLHAGEPIDPRRDVAIVAGVGLQLEEHGERASTFRLGLEQHAEVVEQTAALVWRRCRRFGGAFEPFDRGGVCRRGAAAAGPSAAAASKRSRGERTAVSSDACASSSMPISRYVRASVMCCAEKSRRPHWPRLARMSENTWSSSAAAPQPDRRGSRARRSDRFRRARPAGARRRLAPPRPAGAHGRGLDDPGVSIRAGDIRRCGASSTGFRRCASSSVWPVALRSLRPAPASGGGVEERIVRHERRLAAQPFRDQRVRIRHPQHDQRLAEPVDVRGFPRLARDEIFGDHAGFGRLAAAR